jgi:hypothetical protein
MTIENQDQQLVCIDCKQEFVFTQGEQKFFAERNFTPPKRCKPCRDAKKADKAQGSGGGDNGGDRVAAGNGGGNDNAAFWTRGDNRGGSRDENEGRGGGNRRRRR